MAKRSRSRSRRSLTRGSFRQPLSLARPVVVGAAGALAVNGIVNHVPLPDAMKAGNMIFATRATIALILGIFGPRLPFVGAYAREAAIGSLIVTAADFGKLLALQQGVNLSGTGYVGPARVMNMRGGTGMLIAPGQARGNPLTRPASGVGMMFQAR